MLLSNIKYNDPVEILKKDYIIPSGMSKRQFAKKSMMGHQYLTQVLNKKIKMSAGFIEKISRYTATSVEFWHQLQIGFEFEKYCLLIRHQPIKPIKKRLSALEELSTNMTKGSLSSAILRCCQDKKLVRIRQISCETGISEFCIIQLIKGKLRISPEIAKKLSCGLGNRISFWINMQAIDDISTFLNENSNLSLSIQKQLRSYKKKLSNRDFEPDSEFVHSGKIISAKLEEYPMITQRNWSHLFGISMNMLNHLQNGKMEMSIPFIFKLSHVFDTNIDYWLDLKIRDNVHAAQIATHKRIQYKKRERQFKKSLSPGEILLINFLFPMNWTIKEFANHIDIRKSKLDELGQGEVGIDFELARKLGDALETGPMYWLELQLKYALTSKKHHRQLPIR